MDDLAASASCSLEVKKQGASSSTTLSLDEGTNSLKFSNIRPGSTVGLFRLACTGGNAIIDWVTISNGAYALAPLVDIEATANPTKVPSGGRMSFVRPSEAGNYLFMGSDVGGLSCSTDGESWEFANGKSQDFIDRGDMGTWDAWYSEAHALSQAVVATGDNVDGDGGGLWTGSPGGTDWTEILVSEDLGFTKHNSGCTDEELHDLYSSGKILVNDPADDWDSVYALAQRRANGIDTSGVYRVTGTRWGGTPAICEPYVSGDGGLPVDAFPTAAAIVTDEAADQSWLLVGYTVRNFTSDAGRSGLYLCPLVSDEGGTCDGTLECFEVFDDDGNPEDEALDVRDIEVNPMVPNQVFIADGGKRGDGNEDGTCATAHAHSTVYAMTVTASAPGVDPVVELWDTDATDTTNRPSWSVVPQYADNWDTGGTTYTVGDPLPYYHPTTGAMKAPLRGCAAADDSSSWIGDLVPPNNENEVSSSIVSVVADPDAGYLFAFYQAGDGIPGLDCVRHFRSHLEGADPVAEGTVLNWHPLLDFADRDDNFLANDDYPGLGVVGGTTDRFASIYAGDGYLDAEPIVWTHSGAMHDAVFWDDGSASYPLRLLLAAQYPWWIPQTDDLVQLDGGFALATGWDAEDGVDDLDKINFFMSELGARTFQDGTFFDVATLPGGIDDGAYEADLTYAAAGDISLFTLHGHEDPDLREAADRDCHLPSATIAAGRVDVWTSGERDDAGDLVHEAWYSPIALESADYHDSAKQNMIFHRRASSEWCWDAVSVAKRSNNMTYDTTGDLRWELTCLDSGQFDPSHGTWNQCNASNDPDATLVFGFGNIGRLTDLVALGENTALVVAAGRCDSADGDDSNELCAQDSGEGLWVVYDDGATGLRYEEVTYEETVPSVPGSAGDNTCDKVSFFEGIAATGDPTRGAASLSLHPDTDTATGGTHVRVFISTKTCGVREVEFELGDEDVPLGWTAWPHDACPLGGPPALPLAAYVTAEFAPTLTWGATVTPDGSSLLVFGGNATGDTSSGGGVCAISLATGAARTAIAASDIRQAITSVVPHPDVEGLYAVTAYREGEDATAGASGVYLIQRRSLPWVPGEPTYASRRISGDDLDHARGIDAAWGEGRDLDFGVLEDDPPPTHDHLYFATIGGGPWDLDLAW